MNGAKKAVITIASEGTTLYTTPLASGYVSAK